MNGRRDAPFLITGRLMRAFSAGTKWVVLVLAVVGSGDALHAQSDTARPTASDQRAQRDRARLRRGLMHADSLLQQGRVSSAESLYFDLARRRPHEPAPRLALGRYLAARGATRIAAVLFEEALQLGASPAAVAIHLAPLYTTLGAWQSLTALPSAPLTSGERERAAWLVSRESVVAGPDTVAVPVQATTTPGTLGAIVIRFGPDSVIAELDLNARGLVLDHATRAASIRRFTGGSRDARQAAGAVDRLSIGTLSMANVPVSFASVGGATRARIGLDFLLRFAPSVHPATRRLVLRRTGRLGHRPLGTRYALLMDPTGARVARQGGLELVSTSLGSDMGRGWTVDARLGELVVHQ